MKRLILVAFLIIHTQISYSQAPDTLWTRTLGGAYWDEARKIIKTSDGGYAIIGLTQLDDTLGYDAYFIKLNNHYDVSFSRHNDFGGNEEGFDIIQLPTGGYFYVGNYLSERYPYYSSYFARTSIIGFPFWQDTLGYRNPESESRSVIKLNDGYLTAGVFDDMPSITKLDSSGDAEFTHTFGEIRGKFWEIKRTLDGGYVITGWRLQSESGGGAVMILTKIDSTFETVWDIELRGDLGYEIEGRAVVATPDSGYLVAGHYNSEAFVAKYNCDGNFIWLNMDYGFELANTIFPASDSGYLIVGFDLLSDRGFVTKINDGGEILWQRLIRADTGHLVLRSAAQADDGNILVVGDRTTSGNTDIILILLGDPESDIDSENKNMPVVYGTLQNYPNPFNRSTSIEFTLPRKEHATLSVFDILGRKVIDIYDQEIEAGYHRNTITMDVPSGVYLYRLQAGNTVITRKLTLLK